MSPTPNERRVKRRFQVDTEVSYQVLSGKRAGLKGIGKCLDISSGAIRFSMGEPVAIGTSVEVTMDWPVAGNDSSPLQLIVKGGVMRCDEHTVVVSIARHEFRARSDANRAAMNE